MTLRTLPTLLRRLVRRLPVPAPVLLLAAAAPLLTGFASGPVDVCGSGLDVIRLLDGLELCTHGADPEPAGADVAQGPVPGGPVPANAVHCSGDGTDGPRVQVVYAHESGTSNRAGALDADLRRWAGQVEWTVAASARQTGGSRHVRFTTDGGSSGCRLSIVAATLRAGAFDSFSDTLDALRSKGFDRRDRKYLVFADTDRGLCGVATVPNDDRKAADNRANTTVGYARVDADCWTTADRGYYSVAAHELIHTIGGVQRSAPNATDGRHCTDEFDVMCYADGQGVTVTTRCTDGDTATAGDADAYNRLLDCGHDDYFHTAPSSTSYLGRHWNTADSSFLTVGGDPRTADTSPRRDVADDPRGRPTVWSGPIGAAVRPLLPDAHGWEVCDLPITVRVADGTSTGGIVGLLGSGASSPLRTSVGTAVGAINGAVGATVLSVDSRSWDGATLTDGQLGVRLGDTAGPHHVDVTSRQVRIVRGVATIDRSVSDATGSVRDLHVLQGLVSALGVGLTDTTGELTSRYPTVGADRTVAYAALRHLYATSCSKDARLDDTVGGDDSQRRTDGVRERVDLASGARTPVAAAVDIASWMTAQRGTGWADRAVICRDDVHADCLAGTALAGERGPVLYVPGGPEGSLPSTVRTALTQSLSTGARVHVLGGTGAVSERVLAQLRDALPGRVVHRVAGPDRFSTAVAVAREAVGAGGASKVILTRADNPADAVASGAAAAEHGVPILLTATDVLPGVTRDALVELGVRTVLIAGGAAAVDGQVEAIVRSRHSVVRLSGRDRFETAVAIARAPSLWGRTEIRASGSVIGLNGGHAQTWTLALAASPVGAYLDAPVLFTTADALPSLPRSGADAGSTVEQLRDLRVVTTAPTVRTVYVGAGTWSAQATAEAFHAQALPGFGGNLTVS